jgi:hypothetical protein
MDPGYPTVRDVSIIDDGRNVQARSFNQTYACRTSFTEQISQELLMEMRLWCGIPTGITSGSRIGFNGRTARLTTMIASF